MWQSHPPIPPSLFFLFNHKPKTLVSLQVFLYPCKQFLLSPSLRGAKRRGNLIHLYPHSFLCLVFAFILRNIARHTTHNKISISSFFPTIFCLYFLIKYYCQCYPMLSFFKNSTEKYSSTIDMYKNYAT